MTNFFASMVKFLTFFKIRYIIHKYRKIVKIRTFFKTCNCKNSFKTKKKIESIWAEIVMSISSFYSLLNPSILTISYPSITIFKALALHLNRGQLCDAAQHQV